jgi:hypothetical protein
VASKSKARDLEISLREADAEGQELKRAMKEATDSVTTAQENTVLSP